MEKEEPPKWLEDLQQRSWEPEVLLSGIVLFGMFKVPPLLDKVLVFFKSQFYSTTTDVDNLVGILKLGIYWLILGLILHLICRGVWVGMVGLSYTFPNGVRVEELKFKNRFKTRIEKIPPFQRVIINLEKLCSSLFSLSFMLFMSIVGAYLYFFTLLVLPFFIGVMVQGSVNFTNSFVFEIYVVVVMVIAILGLVDFLTLGFFRRFTLISKVYWPIHVAISALTLGKYYRPIYFGFVSNSNKWVLFLILTLFTVLSLFGLDETTSDVYDGSSFSRLNFWHARDQRLRVYSGYYEDQNEELFSYQAQIPSDIIDGNVLRLFIPAGIAREDSIRANINYDSLVAASKGLTRDARDMPAIQNFYHIYIDDSLLINYPLFYHYRLRTSQPGYLAYIDISSLPMGMHRLEVGGPPSMYRNRWASIPFFRELDASERKSTSPAQEEDDGYFQVKPGLPR
ncbi:hypothetical protein [uncultured Imperialibacter sp.]|uniref:hypothetical protein n=1 Tax=uncultured Imperialibacter sp. TaxID=1672639 RepID=UPI0030DA0B4B|tara:strand:+ start:10533 stop:11891 length:1359 start_codon:yes stop_codon:yes gene_type:complete